MTGTAEARGVGITVTGQDEDYKDDASDRANADEAPYMFFNHKVEIGCALVFFDHIICLL